MARQQPGLNVRHQPERNPLLYDFMLHFILLALLVGDEHPFARVIREVNGPSRPLDEIGGDQ